MPFQPYSGDLIGLPTSDAHVVFKWSNPDCKILFSASRQGNAMSLHFASDKPGLRNVKSAIESFVIFIFDKYPWCEMVLAKVQLPSVGRLIIKLGFELLTKTQYCSVYIKLR